MSGVPERSACDCLRSATLARPRRTYAWKLALVLARCGSRLLPGCACRTQSPGQGEQGQTASERTRGCCLCRRKIWKHVDV